MPLKKQPMKVLLFVVKLSFASNTTKSGADLKLNGFTNILPSMALHVEVGVLVSGLVILFLKFLY